MDTIRPVTFRSDSLAQLGFSAVAPRCALAVAQLAANTEVTGWFERSDSAIGRKTSLSTADMASKMELTEASHE